MVEAHAAIAAPGSAVRGIGQRERGVEAHEQVTRVFPRRPFPSLRRRARVGVQDTAGGEIEEGVLVEEMKALVVHLLPSGGVVCEEAYAVDGADVED